MELKSRGEKISVRHLAPANLQNLKQSLSEQLEVVPESTAKSESKATATPSKDPAISLFTTLPYRPRTSVVQ